VDVSFEESGAAEGLRKASAREGTLRIVTIRDLDRSACGGTHVRATGEIGPILIRRQERVRKAVRLEFLCGGRAVRAARVDHDLLAALAASLSAAPEELPALVETQRTELKAAAATRREMETALAGYRALELYAAAAGGAGARVVTVREEAGPVDRLRPLAQAVAALPRAVFIGAVAAPASVLVAASEDSGVDAGRLVKEMAQQAGGRGGGNPRLAQGSIPDPAALRSLLEALAAAIAKL
jgi:alanyl-tRNA synthetase